MSSATNRRNDDRIAFRVPAHITVGAGDFLVRGYVMNLSEWGALVMMEEALPLDEDVRLEFHRGVDCCAEGRLAHVMPFGHGQAFGVELTQRNAGFCEFMSDLSEANDAKLMDMIRDLKRISVRVAPGSLSQ
jgi:hypothetical protein